MIRIAVIVTILTTLWQVVVWITEVPAFILPAPYHVAVALVEHSELILFHASVTIVEILLGLVIGCVLGLLSALIIFQYQTVRGWLLPVLVVSQALPVFAIAPLLILWLGYGMASKVAMATLIIYFPITAALFDGLRSTERGWVDIATIMGASKRSIFKGCASAGGIALAGIGIAYCYSSCSNRCSRWRVGGIKHRTWILDATC